jgi:hypothetical protein
MNFNTFLRIVDIPMCFLYEEGIYPDPGYEAVGNFGLRT